MKHNKDLLQLRTYDTSFSHVVFSSFHAPFPFQVLFFVYSAFDGLTIFTITDNKKPSMLEASTCKVLSVFRQFPSSIKIMVFNSRENKLQDFTNVPIHEHLC